MPINLGFNCNSTIGFIYVTMTNTTSFLSYQSSYTITWSDDNTLNQSFFYNTPGASAVTITIPTKDLLNLRYVKNIAINNIPFVLQYFSVSTNNQNIKFTGINWYTQPYVSSLLNAFGGNPVNNIYPGSPDLTYVNIGTEVTTGLTDMTSCFRNCTSLIAISGLNFSTVKTLLNAFNGATSFNSDISNWNVNNVTHMGGMFYGATAFNNGGFPLNWGKSGNTNNVSNVTNMDSMFGGASSFNQNISSWNVSNVTTFQNMFNGATAFNNGATALTTDTAPLTWNISQTTSVNMMSAFVNANSFSQDLSWNITSNIALDGIFSQNTSTTSTSMTSTLFNRILNRWANQSPGSTNNTFMTIKYGPSLQATADVTTLRGRGWNINGSTSTSDNTGLVSYNPTSPYWERRFTLTYSVVSSPPIADHGYKLYNVGDTVNPISTYTGVANNLSYVFPGVTLYGQTDYTTLMIVDASNSNIVDTVYLNPRIACFKVGTKILTDRGYVPIEDLRKGDMVKTAVDVYKPIYMIGRKQIYNHALPERIDNQLYVCTPQNYPDVFEDLVITGCHSILENDFASPEQKEKTLLVNKKIFVTTIDCGTYKFGKCRIPACVDERANIYEKDGPVMVYHMALENDDMCGNYGVYANGLLVETCSKRYLDELSYMHIVN